MFGEKDMNAKFFLKLQLSSLKIHDVTPLSNHINDLMSLFRQLAKIGLKLDTCDAKEILLNNPSPMYRNIVFTLIHMSSQSVEEMVSSLLAYEKKVNLEASHVGGEHELALFSKTKIKKMKSSTRCFYYHKYRHTT